MDDFNISALKDSRNEWCIRLMNILTPQMIIGIRSIFNSAKSLCAENKEMDKYLLTFQNFLTRIPKWNSDLIKQECDRICEASGCKYLEDLITCVHIIQLKMLTSIRVGNKQKKVDLNIPKLEDFLHKAYIHVARQLYNKAYLFSTEVKPIEQQKNNTEIEAIIQKCILDAVRDSIPLEYILRSYLEETEEVVDEIKEEIIKETIKPLKQEQKGPQNGGAVSASQTAFETSSVPSNIPTPFDDITTKVDGGSYLENKPPTVAAVSAIPEIEKFLPPPEIQLSTPTSSLPSIPPPKSITINTDDLDLGLDLEDATLDIVGGEDDALELNF